MNYTKAIVRAPGRSFINGITSQNLGKPDYKLSIQQHEAYCDVLKACDVDVMRLGAEEEYPDGCFVEDTAIITEKMAIVTIPGDVRRQGEEISIAKVLAQFRELERIEFPGTVDGGDILRAGDHFFIGLSNRTNKEGAHQLNSILKKYGFSSSEIPVGSSLHLKSSASCIEQETIICTNALAPYFKNYKTLLVSDEEAYACNSIWVNGKVLIPEGFPNLRHNILKSNYSIIELETTEFRKMDGGLSCLSLLF